MKNPLSRDSMIADINAWHPYLDFDGYFSEPDEQIPMSRFRVFCMWLACNAVRTPRQFRRDR